MRSNLVYSAEHRVNSPFLLTSLIVKEVRKMHSDSTRTEDTVNRAFSLMAKCQTAEQQTAQSPEEAASVPTHEELPGRSSDPQSGLRDDADAAPHAA